MTDLATLSTSLHSLVRGTAEEKEHVIIIPLKIQTSQVGIFYNQMNVLYCTVKWCNYQPLVLHFINNLHRYQV